MKGKILIIGISLLSICCSGYTHTTKLEQATYITGRAKECIALKSTDTAWQHFLKEIATLENKMYDEKISNKQYQELHKKLLVNYGINTYDIEDTNTVGHDSTYITIEDVASFYGKEAITIVKNYIDEKVVDDIIARAKALSINSTVPLSSKKIVMPQETNLLIEIVGDYGIIAENKDGQVNLYIIHECFELLNEQDQAFIEQFQTKDFMLRGFSQGNTNSVIEMQTPYYPILSDFNNLGYATSYYQFFKDKMGLNKIRMVINTSDEKSLIRQTEFAPLKKALVYLDEAQLYPLIEEEVEKILQGNLQGKKLQGEKLSCIVRVQDTSIKYKQLIIIEI